MNFISYMNIIYFQILWISNNNKIKINQKTKSNSFEGVGFSINIWNLKDDRVNKHSESL